MAKQGRSGSAKAPHTAVGQGSPADQPSRNQQQDEKSSPDRRGGSGPEYNPHDVADKFPAGTSLTEEQRKQNHEELERLRGEK